MVNASGSCKIRQSFIYRIVKNGTVFEKGNAGESFRFVQFAWFDHR